MRWNIFGGGGRLHANGASPVLAACLCFKDSATYLDEWIRFHFVQGFRKFYLYDNGSSDDWRAVVDPWRDTASIETFTHLGFGVQQDIYNDCLRRAQGQVTWLAFLDDDEFLFPSIDAPLPEVLARYERHAGVAASWVLFGSGGQTERQDGWVIERFTKSGGVADHHVKCIIRPERIVASRVIGHAFSPMPGYHVVDERGRPLTEPTVADPSIRFLRINHYVTKSWEEWKFRRSRPQADTGRPTPHSAEQWREWDKGWCHRPDLAACRFLPAMRQIELPSAKKV